MVSILLDFDKSYKKALAVVYLYRLIPKVQARYLNIQLSLLTRIGTARKDSPSAQQYVKTPRSLLCV